MTTTNRASQFEESLECAINFERKWERKRIKACLAQTQSWKGLFKLGARSGGHQLEWAIKIMISREIHVERLMSSSYTIIKKSVIYYSPRLYLPSVMPCKVWLSCLLVKTSIWQTYSCLCSNFSWLAEKF